MTAAAASIALGVGEISRKGPVRKPAKPRARARAKPKVAAQPSKVIRTSELLRALLNENQDKNFTVEKILGSLGTTSFGTTLMAFSIPEVLPIPIPGVSAIVVIPTGIISAQMMMGKKEITLPPWLLKRSVPRKALAGAIRAILPALEKMSRAL